VYLHFSYVLLSTFCRELTLFWSKLQRRIDPSLDSFLERCRQFGIIAKTLQHLFFLIRVIQSEVSKLQSRVFGQSQNCLREFINFLITLLN